LAHEGAAEAKADPMEGLEPLAAQAHQPASWDSAPTAEGNAAGWADEAAPAQPAQDWTAAPEGAPAEAPAGEGWGTEQGWASETPAESAGEQLPPDAILGEADVIEGFEAAPGWESAPPAEAPPPAEQPAAPSEAEAPDSWASIADPLAAQHDQAANDTSEWGESAPKSEASWRETEQPAEEQAAREQAAQEQAAQEQAAQEQAAQEQAAQEQAAQEQAAEEQAALEQAAEQAAQEQAAEQAAQEQAAEQAAQEQAAQEQAAQEQAAQEQAAQEQAAQEQAAQEQAAQEQAAQEQAAQEQAVEEQYGAEEQLAAEEFPLESGDLKIEGWVAPPAEPEQQGAGWLGEALAATTPLSAADVGTLSAVGVDPNDGVAALRLLACVLRVFNRRQMLDVDEIAAEIRESRTQAAFANEQAAQGEVSNGGEGGETAPPAESAAEATET
jgi:chemotaxis protein histidine kinase CheA